jgi:hypothetical protein
VRVSNVGTSGLDAHTFYWIKIIDAYSLRLFSSLANYNANTPVTLTSYAGQVSYRKETDSGGYIGYITTSDNSINAYTNSDFSVDFDNGDVVKLGSDVVSTGLASSGEYYIKKLSTTKIQLFATAAHASAGTPVVAFTGGNGNAILFDNQTRSFAIVAKFYEMWTSQLGADLWDRYRQGFDGLIDCQMQHVPFGNVYEQQSSSVLKSAHEPYSPLMTAMRALAIARKGSV